MRKYRQGYKQSSVARAFTGDFVPDEPNSRPKEPCHEAVSIRHVIKVERVRGRDSRRDPHFLNPRQDKDGPEHINKLYCNEEQPQRNTLVEALNSEAHTIMSDEHFSAPHVSSVP